MTINFHTRQILVTGSTIMVIACAQLETVDLTGNSDTDDRVVETDTEPPFQDTAGSGPDSEVSDSDPEVSDSDSEVSDSGSEVSDSGSEVSDSSSSIVDACEDDPDKTEPGICGCGVADNDSDGDGAMDCDDECAEDPAKTAPGPCGCGVEAFSCWDCLKPEHCEPMESTCALPTCIEGKCGTEPAPQETKCREAIDVCDAPEYCNGTNIQCPSDTGVLDSCVPKLPRVVSSLGRTLTYTTVEINNTKTTVAYVKPGDTVTLRFAGSVVDSKTECDTCWTQFYASLDGIVTVCLGNSTGDWTFDLKTQFTAPKIPGIYYIDTRDSWQYECEAQNSQLTPNSTVAILRVE